MNVEEFKNEIMESITNRYEKMAKEEKNRISDMLLRYDSVKGTLKIPNDKVVLSASLFSRIFNILAYAESNGICDEGLLNELTADVKNNRTEIESKAEQTKPKNINREVRCLDDFHDVLRDILTDKNSDSHYIPRW